MTLNISVDDDVWKRVTNNNLEYLMPLLEYSKVDTLLAESNEILNKHITSSPYSANTIISIIKNKKDKLFQALNIVNGLEYDDCTISLMLESQIQVLDSIIEDIEHDKR